MPDTTRPCTVYYHGKRVVGVFHQFGTHIYMDDGNHPHDKTIAVVELDDGKVVQVEPDMVTFTDKS